MILKNLLFRLEIQHQQQIKERLELICLLVISKKIMQRNMSLQKKKDKKKLTTITIWPNLNLLTANLAESISCLIKAKLN